MTEQPKTIGELRDRCDCYFCAEYTQEKIADILGCGCFCHTDNGFIGHDGLCCPYPNALHERLLEAFTSFLKGQGLAIGTTKLSPEPKLNKGGTQHETR